MLENKSDEDFIRYKLKAKSVPSSTHPFLKAPAIGEIFESEVNRSGASSFLGNLLPSLKEINE